MSWTKIAIIGAMAEEIELLHKQLSLSNSTCAAGIEFYEGTFHGQQVVVCKSGVGKVNAAVCAQLLIDRFGADCIWFTGVAGALDPSLNIGDVVVSVECAQHDIDASALGFPRGTIPFAPQSVFAAEPRLVELALRCSVVLPEVRTVGGKILSGDQFIADRSVVKQLHEEMGGACTEMEGAAVAQVCAMNGIPYVVIRAMSDKADGSAHINFAEFTGLASRRSFTLVDEMIRGLAVAYYK